MPYYTIYKFMLTSSVLIVTYNVKYLISYPWYAGFLKFIKSNLIRKYGKRFVMFPY